jgi:hypothetical protein
MTRSLRLFVFALLFTAPALQAADIPKPPAPNDWSRARARLSAFKTGAELVINPDDPAVTKANKEALKTAAEFLAYALAQPPINGEPEVRDAGGKQILPVTIKSIPELIKEAESLFNIAPQPGQNNKLMVAQLEYAREFGDQLATATKVVLQNSARPSELINAVRLLSLGAKMPAPGIVDVLVEIVNNDKQSDALKLYAFQGLANFLEQSPPDEPGRHFIKDPAKLAVIALALDKYIGSKRELRNEKEQAVIEFIRRHAIIAVAKFKDGVIRKPNKDVLARPAWTLMRVLALDPAANPAFTLPERVEAAIGFSLMKADSEMNLDVAATFVQPTLIAFAQSANLDYERFSKDSTLPARPWKLLAARLSFAMDTWRFSVKTLPKTRQPDMVTSLVEEALAMLGPIEREGAGAPYNPNDTLARWATTHKPQAWLQNPPKQALLFNDDPKSVLPFAQQATLETPMGTTPKTPPAKTPGKKESLPSKK